MTQPRRAMPNTYVAEGEKSFAANRDFYGRLGFEEVMDLGWIMTMASPAHPTAQVSFLTHDASAPVVPDLSVELGDPAEVDAAYAAMTAAGAEIVHDIRDEDWGVRRFFVRDPQGRVVNVVAHRA
ncbi:VOC family protein [Streptomyces sp. VRA16 Mangrove soil]|uniref:VOC family protein n=1 Tax=Streptomyces sp. VRA16 Mangrove soil TaxID=2817434 RepID=UPI001A9EAE93|nr:VOC family protein [Streptomyces sp. VRA16 Mangrove soil]MBO1337706.1 VOC family protein [Streptomyces sp. VRA16 Mangrove soil]